ncbi:hypothetical protein GDO78_014621 [Eleutherodactylus coqui]|uniref:Uncharacterized protein n=1 Tax=Eleutherodactylus coqui TaxID=57060 RepID=A0A8J6EED2_ELECQ|nr:hypothetical protein GDO78_014621 [Eleutherodactylus coqui]
MTLEHRTNLMIGRTGMGALAHIPPLTCPGGIKQCLPPKSCVPVWVLCRRGNQPCYRGDSEGIVGRRSTITGSYLQRMRG